MDGYNNDKNQWTIKTLVGEAVHSDSPEATKERYPTAQSLEILKDLNRQGLTVFGTYPCNPQ